MNRRTVLLAAVVGSVTALSAALPPPRQFVWNTTKSVPTGLYRIAAADTLRVADRVAIETPPQLRNLLARRGYLPLGVPLIKEIAASPGDTVCRLGKTITINAKPVGTARLWDSAGRTLPAWSGCRHLGADTVFVMNRRAPDSFDGRYFGPIEQRHVIGRALPVWTDEAGDGDRVWFARTAHP